MSGLYFHIPFCKQACHYCDFHFSTNLSRQNEIVDGLLLEMSMRKEYLTNKTLSSIYFGGGTPSLLDEKQLERIFQQINKQFEIKKDCEITLEANPDDLSMSKLESLKQVGVNRLSIGVQSFDDDVLKFLNRSHDSTMAQEALRIARKVGFDNISIDLIYAIPDQGTEKLQQNITTALSFEPEHLSAYSLTIEPKTVFGNWVGKNKLKPVDDTLNADQFALLRIELTKAGYEHYEISNYCKPGLYSKHNSSYWKQEAYLGIGPSAHSYNGSSRQFNVSNNAQYIKSIKENKIPSQREELTIENKINEFIFTTLRTLWGCDLKKLIEMYSYDMISHQGEYLEKLSINGLITIEQDVLKLTFKGMLVADQISLDLLVES